jgi:exopolysaccharide biosynthesis polyprenyl glycosylphosphotransferase
MSIRTQIELSSIAVASKRIKDANSIISPQVQWRLYITGLITSDVATTFAAFWLAYYLRFEWFVRPFDPDAVVSFENYRFLLYTVPFLWLAIFAVNGLYVKNNLLGGTREYSKVFTSASEGFFIIVLAGFLEPDLIIARGWLLITWVFTFLFVAGARSLLRRHMYRLRKHGYFLTPAVIVGANQEGRWLAEQLLRSETSGLHIVGFVDKKEPITSSLFHGLPCLGSVEKMGEMIEHYHIGEVILASSAFSTRDYLLDIFRTYGVSEQVNIRMSSGLYEILTTGLTINEVAYVPLVYVNKVRLAGVDNVLKFILDYLVAIVGLIILAPFLLLIGFCIKISTPGPVLHRRLVMGLNGKQFCALKFRTIVTSGDEILDQHPALKSELQTNHKLKNDPRITPIGAFLRKYSLDELPQLFNVLKRDMSLVGPRMISPEEAPKYNQFVMNLLTVLPGITGLWQISGRSDISYEERVRLDMYYVRNWSLWLDFQLLFQTVPVVLRAKGAY